MENKDCTLQMNELYFSKFDFVQNREDTNTDYEVSFHIQYAENKKDPSNFRVAISTSIKNKTGSLHFNLETIGIFTIDNTAIDKDTSDYLLKVNTVAIMFPFIRSQVSLLTTQPGLSPIMLPPMNVSALIDSSKEDA